MVNGQWSIRRSLCEGPAVAVVDGDERFGTLCSNGRWRRDGDRSRGAPVDGDNGCEDPAEHPAGPLGKVDQQGGYWPVGSSIRSVLGARHSKQRTVAHDGLCRHDGSGAEVLYDGCDAHRDGCARGFADGRHAGIGAEHAEDAEVEQPRA